VSDFRPGIAIQASIIPCFPFNDVSKTLSLGPIGFVKIDVEGAETMVLAGMRSCLENDRPAVLCEVLFTNPNADLSAAKARNAKLMDDLGNLHYEVMHLVKSTDCRHLVEAKKIREFPSDYWSRENAEMCDYLFIPRETETQALSALFGDRRFP